MSLLASLRYFAARLRQKNFAEVAPYVREGLGIETRARKLAVHWQPHLDASRAAQQRWISEGHPNGGRLAVLGAGRLLDFAPALPPHFDHLRLIDADPLCEPFWRAAYPNSHEPVITDVTGCLAAWTAALMELRNASFTETLDHVRSRRAQPQVPVPAWLRECDSILSLNLLSQIAIGWQDRVEAHLARRFGESYVHRHEQEWLAAVEPGARSLVEAHLTMLNASEARHVLFITDLIFLDYSGLKRNYSRRRWQPPPVTWRDGQWIADPASDLKCSACPALCGLEQPAVFLPNFRETLSEQWLWHISPKGTEPPSCTGSIHLVGAFRYEKN